MQSQCFFYRQRIIRINFDFCKIVRNNICDATFYTYKISNFVVNSVIFFTWRLPPFVNGGNWISELNEIRGELKFFKIKGGGGGVGEGGEKEGGKRNFLKFSLGGKLLEMKLQTETKFQNEFKNVFMSYIINYLRSYSFL